MSSIQDLVARYLQIFNETDARRRLALCAEVYAEDCAYTDPLASVRGREGISEFIGGVQKSFPGVAFVLEGAVDAHHEQARFTWHAVAAGRAEPVAIGFDVIVVEREKIRRVHGFLDKAPG
jgi:hypothetical protein